jgi:hypothetical protein
MGNPVKARAGSQVAKLEEARALVESGQENAPGEALALLADVLGVVDSLMAKLARPQGLNPAQKAKARAMYEAQDQSGRWEHSAGEVADHFEISRAAFYRLVVGDKPRS